MKRETAKALLEAGIFQAYANGEPVWYRFSDKQEWLKSTRHTPGFELTFDNSPDNYRLPPKLTVDDWILYGGKHFQIKEVMEKHLVLKSSPNSEFVIEIYKCTPARRVVNPHTFDSAVRAVAEKGPDITGPVPVFARLTALGQSGVKMQFDNSEPTKGYNYLDLINWIHESDRSPFGIVTYEEIT